MSTKIKEENIGRKNDLSRSFLNFCKTYKTMFIATIVLGIIAHGFMLANKLPNHDDLQSIFSNGVTFELGRWGLEILKYVFPNISIPWLNGFILIILISISACFIAKILNIKSKVKQCLIGAVMVTYSSITCTMAYMFTASSYGVAILLSVLCVYFALKTDKKTNLILSVICLIISLSIYQAYLSITATLFIILLIKDCLDKEEKTKTIILRGLKFLAILIVSLLLYLLSVIFVNYFTGNSLSEYQGANEIGSFSFDDVLGGIFMAYLTIPRLILRDFYGLSAGILLKVGYLISFIIICILSILCLIKILKNSKSKAVLFIILGLLLPLTMNSLYLVSDKIEMHSLMCYANFFILVLPLVLIELIDNISKINFVKWFNRIIICVLIIMTFKYITYANECYFELKLSYENAYSFYTTLVTRIESTHGFNENTKVAIIGYYNGGELNNNSIAFSDLDDFTGILSNYEIINAYSKENFIKNYIGVDFNYATSKEINELIANDEYKNMSIYPYDNSIKLIDNIIVVKFSEERIYIVNM